MSDDTLLALQPEQNLFGEDVTESVTIDRALLAASLHSSLKDISVEEFASYLTNQFEAVVDYVNLYAGAKTGQRISLLFNPHRLDVASIHNSERTLYQSLKRADFCNNLARVVILNNNKTRDVLYASIGIGVGGMTYIQEFPPHVARDLAKEYNLTRSSRVLDPCGGWGGRMIGFSTVVDAYTCCEPSSRTAAGLRKLYDWLRGFRKDFVATVHEAPFEDVMLAEHSFDFAFTSPPYYDTERYAPGEATNSFNRYASFDAWVEGFYAPLIHRTMAALKPGASFVINIGSRRYPLNDRLFAIAQDKYLVEKQKGRLSASNGLGKEGEGETFYEVRNPSGVSYIETSTVKDLTPVELPVVELEPTVKLSALAFALAQREPDAIQTSSETSLEPLAFDAQFFKEYLAVKGHRLLTRDGKFFVSESTTLTESERATIKANRDALIALAEPWIDAPPVVVMPTAETPSMFEPVTSGQTLAQFLGDAPAPRDVNFIADEPPDLSGINEVVVNFATDGLDWARGAKPVGITVSTMDGQLCRFLPFAFHGGGNLDESVIKRWAIEQLKGKKITNANTRFDLHIGRAWGVDFDEMGCTFSDVMHTAALLDDHRKRFALDLLAEDFLPQLPKVSRVDETQHARYHASEVAEREKFTAELVWRLRDAMAPELEKQELRAVQALEDRVIPAVVEMEENGAPIDVELCGQWHDEIRKSHDDLLWEISKECGFAFEHTAKGWQRLIESLHLPPTNSYAEDALDVYDHPLITKGQKAAQLASLDSKCFKSVLEKVDAHGILRFELNQLRGEDGGTVTGRFSGPIQQVPNHDNHSAVFGEQWFPRRLYIPGADAVSYFAADAAQIQYRIFAHHANNPKIMAMYAKDPWASFHRMIEGLIRPYKPDLVYSHVKNMNFMRIFGGGIVKLAVMMDYISKAVGEEIRLAKGQRTDPRLAKAREVDAIYARELPEVDPLLKKAMHLAMSKCNEFCNRSDKLHRELPHRGFVRTVLGRRSRFPNDYRIYKAFCMIDQGSEADIMKTKIAELHENRKHTGFKMRMTVHDEVSGDAMRDDTLARVNEVLSVQSFPQLRVPILFECKTGKNWAECK